MTAPRDRLVDTMGELLARRGYTASGLNELVAESGSPKGSIYHYFPAGKEQIAAEALRKGGDGAAAATAEAFRRHRTPVAALRAIAVWLAGALEASDYRYGCPIATTALEAAAESEVIREACADAYDAWLSAIRDGLIGGGATPKAAGRDAVLALSLLEGSLVLCRVRRSTAPLREVAGAFPRLLAVKTTTTERPGAPVNGAH